MERLFYLDIKDTFFYKSNTANASSKPRIDVGKIASEFGFKNIILTSRLFDNVKNKNICHFLRWVNAKWLGVQVLQLKSVKNSIVLIQYPFLNGRMWPIVQAIRENNQIIVLVHDVESLRYDVDEKREMDLFNMANVLIVHTEEMEEFLYKRGCKTHVVHLHFFDYLTSYTPSKKVDSQQLDILFAGNLNKSSFLQKLSLLGVEESMRFLIYGSNRKHIAFGKSVIYKGIFHNEHIETVEGNWGLVWDGEDIDYCSGIYGDYIRINAPFKFSLYLALGIPVIVWSQSAMAQYVETMHLGICVNAIGDIRAKISMLSQSQIKEITDGVDIYSQRVRKGQMLTCALQQSISFLCP